MLPRSSIEIQNQVLNAAVSLPETPLSLHYSSDRVWGRKAAYAMTVPLTGAKVSDRVSYVALDIAIAGRKFQKSFAPQPHLNYTFAWDGKDAAGQRQYKPQPVTVKTHSIYSDWQPPRVKESTTTLGTWSALALGLGGWSFNVHHTYEPTSKVLYLGSGQRRQNIELIALPRTDEWGIPSESGGSLYIFNARGKHLRTANTLTGAVQHRFAYDEAGLLVAIADGDGNTTRILRNDRRIPTAIVAPYGQRFPLGLNCDDYLKHIANPAGETACFSYTPYGLLTGFTDPKGNPYKFEYDEMGRLQSKDEPDGNYALLARTRTEKGARVALVTPSGRESSYLTEWLPDGSERQVNKGCAGAGAIEASTDKDGNEAIAYPDGSTLTETKELDPRFGKLLPVTRSSTFTTPSGKTATVSTTRHIQLADPKDPTRVKKLVEKVDFNGRVSTTTYDGNKRQMTYQSPGGRRSILTLDEKGRVIKSQIPSLQPIALEYGDRGQLLSVRQGDRAILTYRYDDRGRLCEMENAAGQPVRYRYDEAGRVVESVLPSGRRNRFGYDANGNLTEIVVPSGAVHRLHYDTMNLNSGATHPENTDVRGENNLEQKPSVKILPSGRVIRNSYDSDGDLERVSYLEADVRISYVSQTEGFKLTRIPSDRDLPQEVTFGFDATLASELGLVETAISQQNRQRSSQKLWLDALRPNNGLQEAFPQQTGGFLAQFGAFSYERGLITQIHYRGLANGSYRYRYDENFFLVGIQLDDRPEVVLERDEDGLLVRLGPFKMQRKGVHKALAGISDRALKIRIQYDDLGRTIGRTHTIKGQVVYQLRLQYDRLYTILQKQETILGTTKTYDYTYDCDSQLVRVKQNGAVVESYVYDANGNRISGQVGSAEPQTAKYDAQDRIVALGETTYQFDDDGFMARRDATSFEYSSRGELMKVVMPDRRSISYEYDGMGRRVARTDAEGTYQYLYGNPDKPFQVTAIREPSSILSIYYYDELGLLFAIQRGESWCYVVSDQLGTPKVISDENGETVKTLEYDGFGNLAKDSDPAIILPIGFAGGLSDWETKLVRFGFRDYDPACGHWTAKDPIGFAAGDSNLYQYVSTNPVNLVDCTGEFTILPPMILSPDGNSLCLPHQKNGLPQCQFLPTKRSSSYDRDKAVEYAKKYATGHNRKYSKFDEDCTNFVSQALIEGNLITLEEANRNSDFLRDVYYWGETLGPDFTVANDLPRYLKKTGKAKIIDFQDLENFKKHMKKGDIIAYDTDKNATTYEHLAIFIGEYNEEGVPLVAQHTPDIIKPIDQELPKFLILIKD